MFTTLDVPDHNIVVVLEAKMPLTGAINGVPELLINLLDNLPFRSTCSSNTRLGSDEPFVLIRWLDNDITSPTITNHDCHFVRLHDSVLNPTSGDRIVTLHVSTYKVSGLDSMVGPTLPMSTRSCLVVRCHMVCLVHLVVRNEADLKQLFVHDTSDPGRPLSSGEVMIAGENVKLKKFIPTASQAHCLEQRTVFGDDRELQPSTSGHGFLAGCKTSETLNDCNFSSTYDSYR